jgi:hypothetical protein
MLILSLRGIPDLDEGRRFRGGSETFKGWPEGSGGGSAPRVVPEAV